MALTVLGIFPNPEACADAIAASLINDIPRENLEVFYGTELPEGALKIHPPRRRIWIYSLLGGFTGFCFGILLAGGTAWLYKLPTGGKPIFSFPPIGIVTYETTLLFTILFTITAFLVCSRLPALRKSLVRSDTIHEGRYVLAVVCADESVQSMMTLLSNCGAEAVEQSEDPLF